MHPKLEENGDDHLECEMSQEDGDRLGNLRNELPFREENCPSAHRGTDRVPRHQSLTTHSRRSALNCLKRYWDQRLG